MDQTTNPFAPGAGTQPPELAGRDQIIESATIALRRIMAGRPAKSQLLLGLRGVGKTVLLNRIAELAGSEGYQEVVLEAPEDQRLAAMLVPELRKLLFRLSRKQQAKDLALRALGVLRAFAKTFKVKVGDVEFMVDPEPGTADSGSLDSDLLEVLLALTTAARAADSGVALFIDEVQYLSEPDLAALIVAVHKLAQKGLPFILFGAGLPQLAALAGDAKSYAERLFDYPEVGRLTISAACDAIVTPIEREGAAIHDDAVGLIVEKTQGYPYFVQEWGYRAWNAAEASPITAKNVQVASAAAVAALDAGFFRVRLDRLTPREKDYVRAMADLGAGPHRSGEIAQKLGIAVTKAGPLRNGLIKKGMIYSPQHGDTAFTVPMFDEFMRRSMPDWAPAGPNAEGAKRKKSKKSKRGR
ncbi:MAG TPA: ATP-binding protein [Enhygromyxa sp.]|nr:ATP-binding protein [Enhygromyxa sp.]